jgi:hypothetical protein
MIKVFAKQVADRLQELLSQGKLYIVDISGDEIYQTYLKTLGDEGIDTVFRDPNSTSHSCRSCKGVLNRYGKIVSIDEETGDILTLFEGFNPPEEYQRVAQVLNDLIKSKRVCDVFIENLDDACKMQGYKYDKAKGVHRIGVEKNIKRYTKEEAELYGVVKPNETREFHHFYIDIPDGYIDKNSVLKRAWFRDKRNVFGRALMELPLDTINLVEDLIAQGSLLDGDAHLHAVQEFKAEKARYEMCKDSANIMNWFWTFTYDMDERKAKFKNTLIGVLCSEIAEGMDLNKACENWNKRVDPANYHKATAPITKRQIEEAKKFVEDNGYEPSFKRRFVTIDDIKASEIKYMNDGGGKMKGVSLFDGVKATSDNKKMDFSKLEEVSIEKFMKDIVPGATNIMAYFDNKHQNNLVTMTKGDDDSKNIFKWGNNYSWTFNGNLAGKSQIKQAVKTAGGAVDGVLRFSIMWAGGDGDNSDLDAHCKTSNDGHIYFSNKQDNDTKGSLDIDVTNPRGQMPQGAVENITFPDQSRINGKEFVFFVRQFSASLSRGFKAEIEYNGEIHQYEYNRPLSSKQDVIVANVMIDHNGQAKFHHRLDSASSSKEVWGINTQEFHRVKLVCTSPNHWGENSFGNKHYMFMLDECKPEGKIRTFHNENLTEDLLKHRKVMEVLGLSAMIEPNGSPILSGLGFNSTIKDSVVVKVEGSFNRMLKVNF